MNFISGVLLGIGGALSLILEYVPWLRDKWNKLDKQQKKVASVGLMFVITLGVYGLSCFTTWSAWACPDSNVVSFIGNLILAIAANQGVHRATKREAGVGY